MRRWYRWSFACFATISLLAIVAWWLTWQSPGWYQLPDTSSDAVTRMADRAEFRLIEEFQKVRDAEDDWHVRIGDEAINAWLATRLEAWLSHQHDAQMPEGVHGLQVHCTPEGIWLAAHVTMDEERPRPLALRFTLSLSGDDLQVHANGLRVGRLPVPVDLLGDQPSRLTDAIPDDAAIVELMDERHVLITGIVLEEGAVVLSCRTNPP